MHELSIAKEIISIVESEMERLDFMKLEAVNIRIGVLAGINSDALVFGFEASVSGTPMEGAKLIIEEVPVRGHCSGCGKDFEVKEFLFICPHCKSSDIKILEGEELDIDSLTGE